LFLLLLAFIATSCYAAEPINLAGQWWFALDRTDTGIREQWFNRDLPDKINLPGALQSQGYGDEISIKTPWVLSLYDRNWFLRADYSAYTNAGNVKVPFICQPPRHYLGAAWYQRDIEIPADWKDRRVVLFLERPHWESRVWLDDQLIGTNNSLCTPHEFELGVSLKPGKHRLTVRVDNRMILPYRLDAHSVSDSLGQSWNGIVGKMELRSTPLVWISDLQIYPNWERRTAIVRGKLGNVTDRLVALRVEIMGTPKGYPRQTGKFPVTNLNISVPLAGTNFETELITYTNITWDEFDPKLQIFFVGIVPPNENRISDWRMVEFGLRGFRADGIKFLINGRETYLRGTHHGGDFPLTGYPPTDVEYWRKVFSICKEWGLNHMRFHSFCPPEAAFEAADEIGFYLQIEPGMWNDLSPGTPMEKMLYEETERIIKYYGNHPSFVLLSASNEAHGNWKPCLTKWVEHFRAEDPRRLYTPDTGWSLIDSPGPVTNADYLAVSRIGLNPLRGQSAWFGGDYSRSLRNVNVPVVSHELGQWCAYPDFEVIKKFTGYMRPGNYEIFRDSAQKHGVLEYNKQFAWASGRFQLACYKEEIEANLRTPGLSGFQLLDLHDYVGQGTALVGLLDPFWEEKNYVKADEWRQFCGPLVPIVRLPKRVFITADKLEADVDVAHYDAQPFTNVIIRCVVEDASGKDIAEQKWTVKNLREGRSASVGKFSYDLSTLPAPALYHLVVAVADEQRVISANHWNFWLYPAQISNSIPSSVLVTSSWEDAEAKLNSGGRVLFLPRNSDLAWDCPPLADVPIFWNRLMNPGWTRMLGLWCDTNHPALAEFPTEPNCDWQWTQIIRGVRPINLEKLPRGLQPIVAAIDDWNRNWKLGAIFEGKVGKGKLLVCAFDLESDLKNRPVGRQLRRSLLDYMAGEKFEPMTEITMAEFRGLYFDSRIMRKLGARASSDAGDASAAIDGDPNTSWITGGTARNQRSTPYPHQLTITFSNGVAMNGIVLMPRQNDRDHLGDVREYKIESSDDGSRWAEIQHGELASTWDLQKVSFAKTVTAKKLKFTALSGFGNDTSSAVAELAVVYVGPKLADSDSSQIEFRRSRSTSSDVEETPPAAITNTVPRRP
jgi:beta-galactosidase